MMSFREKVPRPATQWAVIGCRDGGDPKSLFSYTNADDAEACKKELERMNPECTYWVVVINPPVAPEPEAGT